QVVGRHREMPALATTLVRSQPVVIPLAVPQCCDRSPVAFHVALGLHGVEHTGEVVSVPSDVDRLPLPFLPRPCLRGHPPHPPHPPQLPRICGLRGPFICHAPQLTPTPGLVTMNLLLLASYIE